MESGVKTKNAKGRKTLAERQAMSPEEERAYWNAQNPLHRGKRARRVRLQGRKDRMTQFALRIPVRELARLAHEAERRRTTVSEMVRLFISKGLAGEENIPGLEERLASLEREVQALRSTEKRKEPAMSG